MLAFNPSDFQVSDIKWSTCGVIKELGRDLEDLSQHIVSRDVIEEDTFARGEEKKTLRCFSRDEERPRKQLEDGEIRVKILFDVNFD